MKFLIILTILIDFLVLSTCGPNIVNPYKSDKKVKHSLYREQDSKDRMSIGQFGVPLPISKKKLSNVKEPEKLLAARIVDHYRKIFDYLDYSPVDGKWVINLDLLNAEELSEAYRDFSKILIN